MPDYAQRRSKALKLLSKSGAGALLVTNYTNVTYLTGFTGDDSYLYLSPKKVLLLTDGRYTEQLESECPDLDLFVRPPGEKLIGTLVKVLQELRAPSFAIEGETMTVAMQEQLVKQLPDSQFTTTLGLVEELREIKDKEELEEIRRSVWLAERAFAVARSGIHPGRTERQIANQIEYQIRDMGGKGCAFETIVGVGPRAALPHGRPTDVPTGEADFTLIDWGAQGRLYKSDLTRIVVTGKISPKLERVYGVVLRAQEAAIDAIRPGATGAEIDAVARKVIADAGFDKAYNHGLGHGIGLNIHEGPRLSKVNAEPLRPGMVITVEPGIYLPGWGGVRIEDDVLVTRTGHEVLTSVPKSLADSVLR